MTDPEDRPSLDEAAARLLAPGEQMLCFACRPSGVCQFGIREVAPAGERRILARLVCPSRYEGGPGVAHGGWVAAALDEVLGHLGPLNGALTVTGTLTVEYLRPAPILHALEVCAWVDRVEGRRWYLEAEMTLAATGARLARAHGIFVERKAGHFENHRRWLESQAGAPPDL